MFDKKRESLANIKNQFSQDIKWHKQDVSRNVRRKKYDWRFKLAVVDHLNQFKGHQEVSDLTGIDIGILKQWVHAQNLGKRRDENHEFQHLKIIFKSAHTSYWRKSY